MKFDMTCCNILQYNNNLSQNAIQNNAPSLPQIEGILNILKKKQNFKYVTIFCTFKYIW